jgi:hypothetical protein
MEHCEPTIDSLHHGEGLFSKISSLGVVCNAAWPFFKAIEIQHPAPIPWQ